MNGSGDGGESGLQSSTDIDILCSGELGGKESETGLKSVNYNVVCTVDNRMPSVTKSKPAAHSSITINWFTPKRRQSVQSDHIVMSSCKGYMCGIGERRVK